MRTIRHQTIERWAEESFSIRPPPGSRGLLVSEKPEIISVIAAVNTTPNAEPVRGPIGKGVGMVSPLFL